MVEQDVRLDCFLVVARVEETPQGPILYHPATPDLLVTPEADPHVYAELHGGQIVSLRVAISSLDESYAGLTGSTLIVPDGPWSPVLLPLSMADLPAGWYNLAVWLGANLTVTRRLRLIHG